jgi:PST family polysaccharide transporter
MFLYRVAATTYTGGNALILAMFAPPVTVGLYHGAEKIARSITSLFSPVCQAFYPRVSHLVRFDSAGARSLARTGLGLVTAGGVVAGLGMTLFPRQALTIALGPVFVSAEPALRTLAPLPAIVTLNLALGFLWLLPNQMDHDFIRITVAAAVLNLGLGTLLSRALGLTGMALAAVLVEAAVAVMMLLCLRARLRPSPIETVTEGVA